jgi:hypothetical protein
VAQAYHDGRAANGTSKPKSTALTEIEEAIVVEFRHCTLRPLDDVRCRLRESLPNLSRNALHRRLARQGISRLPRSEKTTTKCGGFRPLA